MTDNNDMSSAHKAWQDTQTAKNWRFIQFNDDAKAIIKQGLEVDIFKWPVKDGNGYIIAIAVPRWIYEGINTFHSAHYSNMMDIEEFIEKIRPQ